MKVLMTHELFPPDFAGGGEGFVLETAQQLQHLGVDVRVLTTGDPTIRAFEGVQTTRMRMSRYRMNLAVAEIVRHARDVDLIQTFNFHACLPSLLAGRWLRKPVVLFVLGVYGDIWLEMKGPRIGRLYVAWERFLFTRSFSRVVFMSEHSRNMGLALGIPAPRTFIAQMGLHAEQFSPNEEKDVPVLFVGKLEVRKGVWDVLAVAKALPDVKIRMVGWGPEEDALRRAATPNVEFVGVVKGPDLAREYARASIFLLPSRAEGSPVALTEAMASGCAVVCTLPFDFAGAQPASGDVDAIAAAVRALVSNPQEARALGARNAALARERSWEAFGKSMVATYREVLGG